LVLKPTLLGGLAAARRLSSAAAGRGLPVVYSHCYEGPIAFSAIVAASLVDPAATVAAGLGPHAGLGPDWPKIERIDGSMLRVGRRLGLGLEEDLS
jgi:L-alanine-DL-glutamate epimerase-like enolase superfamily enzyme